MKRRPPGKGKEDEVDVLEELAGSSKRPVYLFEPLPQSVCATHMHGVVVEQAHV